jgi:hypothetical protein
MAKSVCRISCKCKIWCFSGCLFYYYNTTFSAKTVDLRESWKIGSLSELKTPVKICQILDNQREKLDLPVQDLENTENYKMIYRKLIITRENDRYIKASYKRKAVWQIINKFENQQNWYKLGN